LNKVLYDAITPLLFPATASSLLSMMSPDNGDTLGAGQDTPDKVLCQYLDGIRKFVSILKKKDFDNILNN
jgi:hypothetical protein